MSPATPADEFRPVSLEPSCLNLRHKLMYCDARHDAPGMVDNSSSTRVFFCIRTHDGLGPDTAPVHPTDCTPGRGCYRCGAPAGDSIANPPPPATTPDGNVV